MSWKNTLKQVLEENNRKAAKSGKAISFATQAARREVLEKGFKDLRDLGYKLNDVKGFKERHMKALGEKWEKEGKSASTIQGRISIFRVFSEWIGKRGMIRESENYVKDPKSVERKMVENIDKTWSGKGEDLKNKLTEISQKDAFVAIQLELQRAFGLRMKEASLLKPYSADKEIYLLVNQGTKGGRLRVLEIENHHQRDVLERAKRLLTDKNQSMTPKKYNFKAWRNHYYYVCKKTGVTRKEGITSHGLRHERLNELYQEISGILSPVKSQKALEGKIMLSHEDARLKVAQVAGHSRASIADVYIGKQ